MKNSKGEMVEVSVQEMVNAIEAQQKAEAEEKKNSAKIKVGGKEVSIQELVASYEKLNAKKNSEDEKDEKENGDDEDEEKDNESDEDDADEKDNEADDEKEAKNSKDDHFKELSNAGRKSSGGRNLPKVENTHSKVQRGLDRYGSKTVN
jgi:hypothetical protein